MPKILKILTLVFQSEPRWPAFRHWLLNIVEQNVPYESFVKVLSRFPEALDNFLINQWHEKATPEQLNRLVAEVMQHLSIKELPNQKT